MKHISLENKDVEGRYGTWVKQMIDMIAPKHLRLIAGRGMTKTTDVIADRSIEVIYDMPRSLQAFVSDTYVNARTNIIPSLIEGWREYKGWKEGVHYVIDERPPASFDLPYKPITTFKNTVSVFNGVGILLGSLDQPSSMAGISIQHLYGDEIKYHNKKKLDVIMPALRGYNKFSHSPYYRGTTFTTDLPNLAQGDYSWIMDTEKDMDLERCKKALYVGFELNEINKKIYRAIKFKNKKQLESLLRSKEKWTEKHIRCRKDLTFFYVVSSMANVDILTEGYIYDMLENLGMEVFKQSVLSIKGTLESGDKFYTGLAKEHFYADGINNTYVESFGIKGDFKPSSIMLNHIDHSAQLDAGVDFGKMISLVIGQEQGKQYRCLKSLFTLVPESSRELGDKFVTFFAPHKNKVLNMYYDRSGNQYQSNDRDWASEVADCIEIDRQGNRTGWKVNLMSREQATIYQHQEYKFMKQLLEGANEKLPILLIDQYQCRELKGSLEMAKLKLKNDFKTGASTIHKDKLNEKTLSLHELPLNSTNLSDAFKYLMMRKRWTNIVQRVSINIRPSLDGA